MMYIVISGNYFPLSVRYICHNDSDRSPADKQSHASTSIVGIGDDSNPISLTSKMHLSS